MGNRGLAALDQGYETSYLSYGAVRTHHLNADQTLKSKHCNVKKHQKCKKVRYRDHEEAIRALQSAQSARHSAEVDGLISVRREIRAYFCSRCKGHHLTSQALRTLVIIYEALETPKPQLEEATESKDYAYVA